MANGGGQSIHVEAPSGHRTRGHDRIGGNRNKIRHDRAGIRAVPRQDWSSIPPGDPDVGYGGAACDLAPQHEALDVAPVQDENRRPRRCSWIVVRARRSLRTSGRHPDADRVPPRRPSVRPRRRPAVPPSGAEALRARRTEAGLSSARCPACPSSSALSRLRLRLPRPSLRVRFSPLCSRVFEWCMGPVTWKSPGGA